MFNVVNLVSRRALLCALPWALAAAAPAHAQAPYPNQPLRLIVPTAPGGGFDLLGRLLAEKLSLELEHPVVVENRMGAGSVVGTQAAALAAPDGYTLVMGGLANMAFNPGLYDKLPYKPSDFVPISLVGTFSYTLLARADLPQGSLKQIADFARANPGKLNIATAGTGTGQQVAAALLKSQARIDLTEVPYKGAQPAYTDLFGGRVDLFFDNTASAKPYVDSGRAKAIMVSGAARDPLLPNTPTARESGLNGLVMESWSGVFAPARTPQPVVERLRAAMAKILAVPDMRKRLEGYGFRPLVLGPAETDTFLKAELQKWPAFLRDAGIKAD